MSRFSDPQGARRFVRRYSNKAYTCIGFQQGEAKVENTTVRGQLRAMDHLSQSLYIGFDTDLETCPRRTQERIYLSVENWLNTPFPHLFNRQTYSVSSFACAWVLTGS